MNGRERDPSEIGELHAGRGQMRVTGQHGHRSYIVGEARVDCDRLAVDVQVRYSRVLDSVDP